MSRVYLEYSSPCRDCKLRYVGCHSDCDKYIKWRSNSMEKPKLNTFIYDEIKSYKNKMSKR